jgi:ankyrin repeat protein
MSASPKHYVPPDAAAQELWRVAESGDVDQLGRLFLRGAHVNARNRHGMTALMKAAFYGHAEMVRALLERGADPNLARNDKFTALALAAFFGHVETVKILIEHGAKTDVMTRCGASAKTWATRRTFVEAAYCIESHLAAPAPVAVSAPIPFPAPVPVAPAPALVAEPEPLPVVKTLKDPPEIWDLVHEAPRTFNPRSAFVARLGSLKAILTIAIAAVLIVSLGVVAGMWVLKRSQARSLSSEAAPKQTVVVTEVTAPATLPNTQSETPAGPQTVETTERSEPVTTSDKSSRKTASTRPNRSPAPRVEQPLPTVESRQVAAAAPAAPKPEPRNNPPKPNNTLSPQLITPAKAATPKGKVIQWP